MPYVSFRRKFNLNFNCRLHTKSLKKMSVVPYDKELEALEEEEKRLDLQIAKQDKLQQMAAKKQQLQELSATGDPTTAMPTVTRTATITVKKGTVSIEFVPAQEIVVNLEQ